MLFAFFELLICFLHLPNHNAPFPIKHCENLAQLQQKQHDTFQPPGLPCVPLRTRSRTPSPAYSVWRGRVQWRWSAVLKTPRWCPAPGRAMLPPWCSTRRTDRIRVAGMTRTTTKKKKNMRDPPLANSFHSVNAKVWASKFYNISFRFRYDVFPSLPSSHVTSQNGKQANKSDAVLLKCGRISTTKAQAWWYRNTHLLCWYTRSSCQVFHIWGLGTT